MDRFPALTTIGFLLKLLAGLMVLAGFFLGFRADDLVQTLVIWIAVSVNAMIVFALAEIIAVFLAIEENTRQTSQALRGAASSTIASPSSPVVRPRMTSESASPSWMTPHSTKPKSGWAAIDEADRRSSR